MKKPTIVCVEDERIVLNKLKEELKDALGEEYAVETAESGEEALEIFKELLKEHVDIPVVIVDYIMPNMKGDELLQRIHTISPKTLKVMLTGQATIEAVTNVINYAKLYRYIAKPWKYEDLKLTIKEATRSYFQEKELTQFYADLELKITKRTHELQQKNEALIKLDSEKQEILSIAVHDLKNPLSVVQCAAELIQVYFNKVSEEEVMKWVNSIEKNSRQMSEIINNLLDVNIIESDKMGVVLSRVDILPKIQALITNNIELAKNKHITIRLQYQDFSHYACVDQKYILPVLENLISNAIKYSPRNKKITIRLSQDEQHMRCEIQDEGPGLSEKDQQKLFSKFTRLTPQPTGGEISTGLGLFIVKKLVEAMNGKIWCESQLGQGSTFILELPIACE